MKNIRIIAVLTAVLVLSTALNVFAREVSFSQDDRDRLIRVEEAFKAVNQRIDDTNRRIDDSNRRIDDSNRRIDEVRDFMLWGFGILFAGMMAQIGFVIWDRRTAITPVTRKTNELEEREERLEKALKEFAKKEPKLAEALRHAGLL